VAVPAWARFLPVESAVRGRVARAFEDTAALSAEALAALAAEAF
jgi:hypothetical protein